MLIAEDEKFLMRALSSKLEAEKFTVLQADNGRVALEMMKSEHPDIVLLDLVMPEMGGFEVLGEAKMDSEISKIPIVILSNLGQPTDMEQAKDLGAVAYYIKADMSLKDLVAQVKVHLAKGK